MTHWGPALAVVVLVAALFAPDTPTPRATPAAVGLSAERLQDATAVLRQAVVDHQVAGAVALVARRG